MHCQVQPYIAGIMALLSINYQLHSYCNFISTPSTMLAINTTIKTLRHDFPLCEKNSLISQPVIIYNLNFKKNSNSLTPFFRLKQRIRFVAGMRCWSGLVEDFFGLLASFSWPSERPLQKEESTSRILHTYREGLHSNL